MTTRRGATLALALSVGAAMSCTEPRASTALPVVFDADVAPILAARCASCHGASAPAAGWSATSYLGAIACVEPTGAAAVLPADARAPIVKALAEPSHRGFATSAEAATLGAWVEQGAPAFVGVVHDPGVVDPRAPSFHGATLRAARWAPMLDASDPDACGRCHDGAPARPAGVTSSAPGATACTACHTEPGGVLACGTCHGDGARAYPPRDPCFFPGDQGGAHAAHVEPSAAHADGYACATCHPMPGPRVIGGLHGDGKVDVRFDASAVPGSPTYDDATGACAVACHDAGGARARPTWTDTTPMRCGDCHGAPPADHPPGACDTCHVEANADGTALARGPLHLNGEVDLGDGSGGCGACHGHGDDPWPSTGAHAAHRAPTNSSPVACGDCHVVPTEVLSPGHIDSGVARVTFSGRATARSQSPAWSGRGCEGVACHGAGLPDAPTTAPIWDDTSGSAGACGACHGVPPTMHTPSTSCGRSSCHAGETTPTGVDGAPIFTSPGIARHVDGVIDVAQ
jgi:predicted CxxxxCH...CXXCH cytochrome family protein